MSKFLDYDGLVYVLTKMKDKVKDIIAPTSMTASIAASQIAVGGQTQVTCDISGTGPYNYTVENIDE